MLASKGVVYLLTPRKASGKDAKGGDKLKKVVYMALVFSLIVNLLLIYDRIENAKKLNISWSNSIASSDNKYVGYRVA